MGKKAFISLLTLTVLHFAAPCTAQVNDAGLWLSVNAEKKITQKFSIGLSQEFRLNENMAELGSFLTDVGVAYKFNKYIRVSANYRFSGKRRLDDTYSKRHRYYIDLTGRIKKKPVIFLLRSRFQSQYADVFSSAEGKIPSYYSRNKFTLKLDLDKKFVPYISAETFTPISGNDGILIDNARYSAGTEYNFNRMHGIDLFLMMQREFNVVNPETDYILGLGYNFSF
jgi:hypothetical protein